MNFEEFRKQGKELEELLANKKEDCGCGRGDNCVQNNPLGKFLAAMVEAIEDKEEKSTPEKTMDDIFSTHKNKKLGLDFGTALLKIKEQKRVSRNGWNGKNMYLELQIPDKNSKMSLPYIYMKTACGNKVPWLASHTDLLATDWYIVV